MADYNEKTVPELKDEAKSRGLSGYSDKNKEELVSLLQDSEDQGDGPDNESVEDNTTTGDTADELEEYVPSVVEDDEKREELAREHAGVEHHTEASDDENPEVVGNLSPEGQAALGELTDTEKKESDLALDASGPLHLQSPSERVQGGSVNEKHAEELEEKFSELPEDHVGNVREDGFYGEEEDSEPVKAEDVIDFPPPLEELEQEKKDLTDARKAATDNAPYTTSEAARAAFPDEGKTVAKTRLFEQRAQLYTDGLSGEADHNTELSYRVPDVVGNKDYVGNVREDQRREDENEPREESQESDSSKSEDNNEE